MVSLAVGSCMVPLYGVSSHCHLPESEETAMKKLEDVLLGILMATIILVGLTFNWVG
ncbi:MAG: hypothetical protein ABSE91_00420 [Patescibacteria group bacterium]|jgi:hypothetical protein